jgi:tagatose 6-phosphate kinase
VIVTVTLNVAMDVTYAVPRLEPHTVHRVTAVWRRGGGKGVNVARLLGALGEEVIATGLAGGRTGELVRADLAGAGVDARFHPIAGETRSSVTVVAGGDATVFNEPGPEVTAAEWAAFRDGFAALLDGTGARVVVLSGSLPRGLPPDAYAVLAGTARRAGARVLLDAGGPALRHGLAGRPHVAKPNLTELAQAIAGGTRTGTGNDPDAGRYPDGANGTGGGDGTDGAGGGDPEPVDDVLLRGARALRAAGAGAVVASRGSAGLVAVTPEGTFAAHPPERLHGNPTGAGDAVAAALARAMLRETPWSRALAAAVALSAAAVMEPVAGAADLDAYRGWWPKVRVHQLSV